MDLETTVSGIPAIARVTRYFRQRPLGPSADSDLDCYGYVTCEYDICDRRGRPAPWLERKATEQDRSRIEDEIATAYEE